MMDTPTRTWLRSDKEEITTVSRYKNNGFDKKISKDGLNSLF